MSAPIELTFVTSAPTVEDLPPSRAEVAIIGRSNVGKSSLLNALANRKGLAKVSSTPGRTQLLNFFQVDGTDASVVDLPGFGYAKTSASNRQAWLDRMGDYLLDREPLVVALLLVDGEIGPAKLDLQMLEWLRECDIPFQVVATKHDKVKSSKRQRRKRDLAEGCAVAPNEVIWTSAEKKVGLERLRAYVREALGVA